LPVLGDRFFVLYGDSYLVCDYRLVQDAFGASGAEALMTVVRSDSSRDTSNVEYANGEILAYQKGTPTSRMQHIDYGLSVFRASAFANPSSDLPWDLGALYQELLKRGRLAGCEMPRRFHEVGSWEGIRELDAYLSGGGQ
jgi:NDP-sugar pyrophosphorylase family protein